MRGTAGRRSIVIVAAVVLAWGANAGAQGTYTRAPAPAGARLYLISPQDGASVESPVVVRFGLSGMGVAPAGVDKEHTGHHHLIVDAELPPLDQAIPSDEHYRHFGAGQTEVSLALEPGRHTLQVLLGDRNHVPHAPPVVSPKVTITVR